MSAISTAHLKEIIVKEAAVVDTFMRRDIELIAAETDPMLVEILEYGLLSGGKRVRPLLVTLAARMCGGEGDAAYELGKAFEYLHAATLIHDDIIDNADTRRGKPSVYNKFGMIGAILSGDFLLSRSMKIIGDMTGGEGLAIFCRATEGIVDGEFKQLRNANKFDMSRSGYYDAILGKTGLLISTACHIGALYGGGDKEQMDQLVKYGEELGYAFQMADDLLDYLGDTKKTGKAVGNDLVEGKMTLPLILAYEEADDIERQNIDRILADEQLRRSEFETVFTFIQRHNGFEETKAIARGHVKEAVRQLSAFTGAEAEESRQVLTGLAHYVVERDK